MFNGPIKLTHFIVKAGAKNVWWQLSICKNNYFEKAIRKLSFLYYRAF